MQLTTEYARLEEADGRFWATRVHVEPTAAAAAAADEEEDDEDGVAALGQQYPAAVYLYLAVDCDGAVPAHACLEAAGARGGMSLQIDRNPGKAAGALVGGCCTFFHSALSIHRI